MRTHTFAPLLERGPTEDQLDQLADVCPDAGFTDLEDGTALAEFDTASSHDLLLAVLGVACLVTLWAAVELVWAVVGGRRDGRP